MEIKESLITTDNVDRIIYLISIKEEDYEALKNKEVLFSGFPNGVIFFCHDDQKEEVWEDITLADDTKRKIVSPTFD